VWADEETAVVDVAGVGYEVTLSPSLAARLSLEGPGAPVKLSAYHYLQGSGQASIPVLLGFSSEAEREFFRRLLTVPGLGPKSALKGLALAVPTLARAIELGDVKHLETIPGVGKAKARDIINKLKGKVADFLEEELPEVGAAAGPETSVEADALEVMTGPLQLPKAEALSRIRRALAKRPAIDTVEELIAQALRE
jgi:Holliday junction DNA helicase RuvA